MNCTEVHGAPLLVREFVKDGAAARGRWPWSRGGGHVLPPLLLSPPYGKRAETLQDLPGVQGSHGDLPPELRRQRLLQLQGLLPPRHPAGQAPPLRLQGRRRLPGDAQDPEAMPTVPLRPVPPRRNEGGVRAQRGRQEGAVQEDVPEARAAAAEASVDVVVVVVGGGGGGGVVVVGKKVVGFGTAAAVAVAGQEAEEEGGGAAAAAGAAVVVVDNAVAVIVIVAVVAADKEDF